MIGLRWLDSMSVGIASFDNDHKLVIALLGEIATAANAGSIERAVEHAAELMLVAAEHTDREERFLRAAGYPGTDTVIAAQRTNLAVIANLAEMVGKTPAEASRSAQEMAEAFVNYLLRADINYKSYVEMAGFADRD